MRRCLTGSLRMVRVVPLIRNRSFSCHQSLYLDADPEADLPPPRTRTAINPYSAFDVPKRVYVLGTGNVGKFIAHSLAAFTSPPPITLLLHKPDLYQRWFDQSKRTITLIRNKVTDGQTRFRVELTMPGKAEAGKDYNPAKAKHPRFEVSHDHITNLIVTVKAHQTVSALLGIKDRLTSKSSILFLQNGMGIPDEVNAKVFPDPTTRPSYLVGIISHGLFSKGNDPFEVTHAGHGTIQIGLIPRTPFTEISADASKGERTNVKDNGDLWPAASRYLLRQITRVPVLAAVGISPTEMKQAQLEKLAVNCIVNPLTVMLDNRNGSVLGGFALKRVMRLLIAEISLVLRTLPELRGIPNVELRFSPDRLENMVEKVASATSSNISSMLQDVRRGLRTEIEYLNGYIVKRGEEMGIKPVLNYMLMQLVIGKQLMINQEVNNYLPYDSGNAADAGSAGKDQK